MSVAISKTEKLQELLKCGQDPKYFIRKYVYIQHPVKGRIKFTTFPYQDDVVDSLENHRFNIVLKSRQLGLSTICAAYATWLALFYKDKNIIVIATKLETAQNFVKKVKIALQSLPPWMLIAKHDDQRTQVNFTNGSRIVAIPTSPDAGRSEAISLLIVDEAAFIRDFDTLWTGLYPTISTGGNAFILSTPNGVGGQFYQLWIDAEAGINSFNTIRLPWQVHPEHDEQWFKEESKGLSKRKIQQEFLCGFLGSGETFLNPDDLDWLRAHVKEPIEKQREDRSLWIWEKPEKGKKYVMPADIARGDSKDYSAMHVINADDGSIVAEYMGKAPPEIMGQMMVEVGKAYNNALAVPENNTFGYATAMYLKDAGYPNLYYQTKDQFEVVNDSTIPGFSTQKKSRINILTKLEELIRNKMITSRSARLVQQLQTFVWENSKPQAMKGSHDDLIMSVAIGLYVVSFTLQTQDVKSDQMAALLASTSKISRNVLPGIETPYSTISSVYDEVRSQNKALASSRAGNLVIRRVDPRFNWLLK